MMLTIAWCTDPHLNFIDAESARLFARSVADAGAMAFVLTGDVGEAPELESHLGLLAEEIPGPLFYVLGNHDYYFGGIAEVRARAVALSAANERLVYLSHREAVALSESVGLLGVDGWGDARLGDVETSGLWLNDFRFIDDLRRLDSPSLWAKLRTLGEAEAAGLEHRLVAALERFDTVVVATHVPPFAEACSHEGRRSGPDWLPYFTCKAVGDVLLAAADRHPRKRILVLCGHTHSDGDARLRPNLRALTSGAHYGTPEFRLLRLGDDL